MPGRLMSLRRIWNDGERQCQRFLGAAWRSRRRSRCASRADERQLAHGASSSTSSTRGRSRGSTAGRGGAGGLRMPGGRVAVDRQQDDHARPRLRRALPPTRKPLLCLTRPYTVASPKAGAAALRLRRHEGLEGAGRERRLHARAGVLDRGAARRRRPRSHGRSMRMASSTPSRSVRDRQPAAAGHRVAGVVHEMREHSESAASRSARTGALRRPAPPHDGDRRADSGRWIGGAQIADETRADRASAARAPDRCPSDSRRSGELRRARRAGADFHGGLLQRGFRPAARRQPLGMADHHLQQVVEIVRRCHRGEPADRLETRVAIASIASCACRRSLTSIAVPMIAGRPW